MTTEEYIDQLNNQVFFGNDQQIGSVRWYIKWYREKANNQRLWFRWVGGITLFLSISLPFVVGLSADEKLRATIATTVSWLIAIFGGASVFFQWSKSWQSYTQAYMDLERQLMTWELVVSKLIGSDDGLMEVQKAAEEFVINANVIVKDETKSYFEEVKFPNMNTKK